MNHQNPEKIQKILADIYAVDPSLASKETLLVRLITELEHTRPAVALDDAFVADLRASLLTYKNIPAMKQTAPQLSVLWWSMRLAPVALVALIIVVLNPTDVSTPTYEIPATPDSFNTESYQMIPAETDTMDTSVENATFKSMVAPEADTARMSAPANYATPLDVPPPRIGNTMTVNSVSVMSAGWLVVSKDNENGSMEILSTTLLTPQNYSNLTLSDSTI